MSKLGVDIARAVVKIVGRMPLKVHYVFADVVAWLAGKVVGYRDDVVMINLSRSFPEKKYRELQKIRNEFYRHFAEIFVEAIWFGASDYKRLHDSGIVTITNPEILNEYLSGADNMTVMFSHCGNWEILGGFLGYRTADGVELDLKEEQIVISKLEIEKTELAEVDGFYNVLLKAELNREVGDAEVSFDVYVDGNEATIENYAFDDHKTYTMTVKAKVGETIKAVVSGTQTLENGRLCKCRC